MLLILGNRSIKEESLKKMIVTADFDNDKEIGKDVILDDDKDHVTKNKSRNNYIEK